MDNKERVEKISALMQQVGAINAEYIRAHTKLKKGDRVNFIERIPLDYSGYRHHYYENAEIHSLGVENDGTIIVRALGIHYHPRIEKLLTLEEFNFQKEGSETEDEDEDE